MYPQTLPKTGFALSGVLTLALVLLLMALLMLRSAVLQRI